MTMPYDPQRHQRRSIRLRRYDYSQPGGYFVTMVTQGRACMFGEVVDGTMRLNDAGRMVRASWEALPRRFPTVALDAFVVMPNHIHGIIVITANPVGAGLVPAHGGTTGDGVTRNGATTRVAPTAGDGVHHGAPDGATTRVGRMAGDAADGVARDRATTRVAPTVGDVVGAFKSWTTVQYVRGVGNRGWMPFDRRLWQRNYYEHIIRNENSLAEIRRYIAENPLRWQEDAENPAKIRRQQP